MQKKIKHIIGTLIILTYVVTIISSAAPRHTVRKPVAEGPGLYELTGYMGTAKWKDVDHYVASPLDIDGKVGYELNVQGATARCVPSTSTGWTLNHRILSGTLPTGLEFLNGSRIKGIPTERGHWIVKIELYDITCNGTVYMTLQQELRFHITGSGIVR